MIQNILSSGYSIVFKKENVYCFRRLHSLQSSRREKRLEKPALKLYEQQKKNEQTIVPGTLLLLLSNIVLI